MNPARHLGTAVVSGSLDNWWVYWIGPFIGAAVAALSCRYVFAPAQEREPIVIGGRDPFSVRPPSDGTERLG